MSRHRGADHAKISPVFALFETVLRDRVGVEMRKIWRAAVAVGMLWLLAACAGTTEVMESQGKARSASQARLYFLRNTGVVPSPSAPDVKINGQNVGSIATGTYFSVDRPPGSYTLAI